jgi:hypothetical protein
VVRNGKGPAPRVEGGPYRLATPSTAIGGPNDGRGSETATTSAPGTDIQTLATAVYVAGTARLSPGTRYGLALGRSRLLVLGPIDLDPFAVVLDRAVAEIEVRAVEGRLVVSEPGSRSGLVLAFMSLAGTTAAELVAQITDAARTGRPAR